MSRDWDSLQGFEDWSNALHELLEEARKAVESKGIDRKVQAQKALDEFIDHSPNVVAKQLDEIARKTINDIFIATFEESLNAIAARTAQLAEHVKIVTAVTNDAARDADSIRLLTARRTLSSLENSLKSLLALKKNLDSGTASLVKDIDAVSSSILSLKKQVEVLLVKGG